MIRVPWTTTRVGRSDASSATVSSSLTDRTRRTELRYVVSTEAASRISARRRAARCLRTGWSAATNRIWPTTETHPIRRARRRAIRRRDGGCSTITKRSDTREPRKLATMSVASSGPARSTSRPPGFGRLDAAEGLVGSVGPVRGSPGTRPPSLSVLPATASVGWRGTVRAGATDRLASRAHHPRGSR